MKQDKETTPSPSFSFRKMSEERLSVVDEMPKYNEATYCSFRDWAAACYLAGKSKESVLYNELERLKDVLYNERYGHIQDHDSRVEQAFNDPDINSIQVILHQTDLYNGDFEKRRKGIIEV